MQKLAPIVLGVVGVSGLRVNFFPHFFSKLSTTQFIPKYHFPPTWKIKERNISPTFNHYNISNRILFWNWVLKKFSHIFFFKFWNLNIYRMLYLKKSPNHWYIVGGNWVVVIYCIFSLEAWNDISYIGIYCSMSTW